MSTIVFPVKKATSSSRPSSSSSSSPITSGSTPFQFNDARSLAALRGYGKYDDWTRKARQFYARQTPPDSFIQDESYKDYPYSVERFNKHAKYLSSTASSQLSHPIFPGLLRRPPLVPSHYIPPLKIEPEPTVVALDLRICKQNESISQYDFSVDILGDEPSSESKRQSSSPAQSKRTPSPLPPPSSLAVSMSFKQQAFFEPLPLMQTINSSAKDPYSRPKTTPSSPFPSEARLQNLSPLERMKLIGAHHQRFQESLSKSLISSPLKRPRELDPSDCCMDNKIRKIEDVSSEARNLIVLPSRSDALTFLCDQEGSSPPSGFLKEEVTKASLARQIQLKRRLSPDAGCIDPSIPSSFSNISPLSCSYPGTSSLPPSNDSHIPTEDKTEDVKELKKTKRGRPRKHTTKVSLPPLYVFIRNLIYNEAYNPRVISWINERAGIFKVNQTAELAQTWGKMKRNRSEEMNYEKMSRALRYHYGNEKQGRKGHLAMVKEKRLVYQFGELAINWKAHEISHTKCKQHSLCRSSFCLWSKE